MLCPSSVHPTRVLPLSAGQGQLNITDYFKVPWTQQVGAGGTKSRRIKEELLDPTFTDDSFSNDSAFLEDDDFVPAPKESSRKQPLSTAGTLKPEHDLWAEPEKKPLVVHPEHSWIKQELDDMEIEPVPDTHYGLLGTRTWEVPQGSIDMLPVEVLRNIFAFLPVIDLYQNLSLVCRCWRDIVSDPLVRTCCDTDLNLFHLLLLCSALSLVATHVLCLSL